MAVLAPTAANVTPGTGARYYDAIAGEALTQGQVCYIGPDNEAFIAAADADPAVGANAKGIALNVSAAGQPVRLQVGGVNAFDGDATEGVIYVLASSTPGAVQPAADLLDGDRVVIIGVGNAAGGLVVNIWNSGEYSVTAPP